MHSRLVGNHTRSLRDILVLTREPQGPTITADAVVGRDGFLVGGEGSYDVTAGAITRYAGAVGFSAPEYALTLHALGNLSTYALSYYHKANKDVEVGGKLLYDTKSTTGGVSLEIGAKTYLVKPCLNPREVTELRCLKDNAAFVKAKINNAGILCLGYTQAFRPGVKVCAG